MSLVTRHLSLYFASTNPAKLHEFRDAARARGIAVDTVPRYRELPPCAEDGTSFQENARKKALHYGQFTEGWVFADDSGICVDALRGAPGVYSARFSGPDATEATNNAKLLRELERLPASNRSAHYACVIALARRRELLGVFEGRANGLILSAPRGSGGFGYDPLFLYPPLGKTFAELSPEEKFAVSHRGAAFRRLLDYLQGFRPQA